MAWIALLIFFLLLIAAVSCETLWLVGNGWAGKGKAAAYVITSDLIGLGLGLTMILLVFLVTLMMAFGPAGTGSTAPEAAYWAALVAAIIVPLALLVVSKRVFLAVLKIDHNANPWVYSVTTSVLAVLLMFLPPTLLFYLIASIWT